MNPKKVYITKTDCKSCDEIREEVEILRQRLCAMRDSYSRICEELWTISHKKRRS